MNHLTQNHFKLFSLNPLKASQSPEDKLDPHDVRKQAAFFKRFSCAMMLGGTNSLVWYWSLKALQVPHRAFYFAPVAAISLGYVYWEVCRIRLDADRYLYKKSLEGRDD